MPARHRYLSLGFQVCPECEADPRKGCGGTANQCAVGGVEIRARIDGKVGGGFQQGDNQ